MSSDNVVWKIRLRQGASRITELVANFDKILVIGATGRVGSLLRALWPDGMGVWQSRQPKPGFVTFDPLAAPSDFAAAAHGVAGILCLAGIVPGSGRADGFEANVQLGLASIRAANTAGTRVFLASTAAVYGNKTGLLREDTPPRPVAEYGRSKMQMERVAARVAVASGVPLTVLRIGNIGGLDAILGNWKPGFQLDQFPDGTTPHRSYIGVASLAQTLAVLMQTPSLPGCLNIAEPGAIAMGDLLDAAGLGWSPRPASDTAIARVEMDVSRLSMVTDTLPKNCDPGRLVQEWQDYSQRGEPV